MLTLRWKVAGSAAVRNKMFRCLGTHKAELNTNPRQHRFANAVAVRGFAVSQTNGNAWPPHSPGLGFQFHSTSVRLTFCEFPELFVAKFEYRRVRKCLDIQMMRRDDSIMNCTCIKGRDVAMAMEYPSTQALTTRKPLDNNSFHLSLNNFNARTETHRNATSRWRTKATHPLALREV
jgi:hypothetical protein